VDFDVKTDFQEHGKGVDYVRDTISKLLKYVNPKYRSNSATYREGYSHFNKPNNCGLQFLDRKKSIGRSQKPYQNQFCKFYHKSLMLSSDKESNKFAETYLQGQNTDNILRYESAVKGNALRDYYGLPNTLGELLEVDESTLLQILRKPLEAHFDFNKVEKVKTDGKKTGKNHLWEKLVSDHLNELMKPANGQNGINFDDAVLSLVNEAFPIEGDTPFTQVEKNGRSRLKTQIVDAWQNHQPNKKVAIKNAQLIAFPELNKRLNLRLAYK
jgi:hypothetical protein